MNAVAESCAERLRELYPARLGTTLIRLRARDKRPIDSGWNVQAVENYTNQIDPGPIIDSIAKHVDAGGNVGWAIPPGLLVLDADNEASAAWLCQALPDAPRQRTAKGCHVVVREPKGVDLRQVTQFEIVDGITVDLRTSGSGQIAVEPSIHPSGFLYHWELELPIDTDSIPDVPAAVLERMKSNEATKGGPVDIHEATWREGSRETRLVSMAGRLRNMSLSESEIRDTLAALNRERCRPILADPDIARIARSAGKWDRGSDPTDNEVAEAKPETIERISSAAFSGTRLRELTSRPPLDPIYPGIPAKGHMNLLIGPSFAGKTTSALWGAMARAAGVAPWNGAPGIPQGRTLFISPDEPVEQVARQILRLSRTHPAGRTFDYFEHITVLGLDVTVSPETLTPLRFDAVGFEILSELASGFDSVVIDAYADMLPPEVSEDSNEDASRIGGRLEALAVANQIPITLIHHVGKVRGGTEDIDPRDLGRGASALAAKARAISTWEEVPGFTNQRRIRSRTNLTRSPAPLVVEVSEHSTEETSIDFLRPMDPVAAFPINDLLSEEDGWITTSELARRAAGLDDGKPDGTASALARNLRSVWSGAGLIETRKGKQNSTELRRVPLS